MSIANIRKILCSMASGSNRCPHNSIREYTCLHNGHLWNSSSTYTCLMFRSPCSLRSSMDSFCTHSSHLHTYQLYSDHRHSSRYLCCSNLQFSCNSTCHDNNTTQYTSRNLCSVRPCNSILCACIKNGPERRNGREFV